MTALQVQVVSGPHAAEVADRLRAHGGTGPRAHGGTALRAHSGTGLLAVSVVDRPGLAAIVIAARPGGPDERAADVLLDADRALTPQVDQLWTDRLGPFAAAMAGTMPTSPGPPLLQDHDPRLPAAAERMLDRLRDGLTRRGLDDGSWTYHHIGSTAVPGLRAKPFIDLQIGAMPLPEEGSPADEVFAAAGFRPVSGARPDSPGVFRDEVKDPDLAPDEAYRKRLLFRADPGQAAILHIRQLGAPWWSYTVRFRDWLRASPAGRREYEQAKQDAAARHAHDADFDGYTRAKGAFFHEVQAEYEQLP